ncbi:unnamed protein product [Periconia digitata]|uniref:BZIP domain-containing protein n=1 Tax=Periconia digitata TaxID=1303443 RepID=A0A9W4XID8_9PLEO|nr:unnamed protein product [Periconia digitata]
MGDNSMTAAVGKTEDPRDSDSCSEPENYPHEDEQTYTQDNPPPQKRKGGRKPIYATSEERKQRNRQAQAAFRERRTEYIKQLESTIKHHEDTLQNLQNSHRNAADECLMLRYKNSLLERILLEKGIDVQAELRAKTGSPNLGPTRAAASTAASPNQAPLQQRAILNRQQQRRSLGGPPKAEGPTPVSHLSSPSTTATRSPNFVPQGTSVSPNFGPLPPQQQQQPPPQQQQLRPQPPRSNYTPMMGPQRPSLVTNQSPSNGMSSASTVGSGASVMTQSSTSGGPSTYFNTPFTDHMSQLEQEYDEQADMLDQEEPSDHSAGPGPYPQNFPPNPMNSQSMQPPMPPANNQPFPSPASATPNDGTNVFNGMNHLFDPYDPMLDADPFGLSASMHFPTMYESR